MSGTSSSIRTKLWWMVLFQNCVRQSHSLTKIATTVQLRCYWKQLWSRWAITGSWEPLVTGFSLDRFHCMQRCIYFTGTWNCPIGSRITFEVQRRLGEWLCYPISEANSTRASWDKRIFDHLQCCFNIYYSWSFHIFTVFGGMLWSMLSK